MKEEILKNIEEYIRIQRNPSDSILEHLIVIQDIAGGSIGEQLHEYLAEKFDVDLEELKETIEFFPFLRIEKGKVLVEVCMGTSCFMAGNSILEPLLRARESDKVEVVERECNEACDYGPRVCVGHKTFQYVTEDDLNEIVDFAEEEWDR